MSEKRASYRNSTEERISTSGSRYLSPEELRSSDAASTLHGNGTLVSGTDVSDLMDSFDDRSLKAVEGALRPLKKVILLDRQKLSAESM